MRTAIFDDGAALIKLAVSGRANVSWAELADAEVAADLVVVDGDPLRDIDALVRPLLVIHRGEIVR